MKEYSLLEILLYANDNLCEDIKGLRKDGEEDLARDSFAMLLSVRDIIRKQYNQEPDVRTVWVSEWLKEI